MVGCEVFGMSTIGFRVAACHGLRGTWLGKICSACKECSLSPAVGIRAGGLLLQL